MKAWTCYQRLDSPVWDRRIWGRSTIEVESLEEFKQQYLIVGLDRETEDGEVVPETLERIWRLAQADFGMVVDQTSLELVGHTSMMVGDAVLFEDGRLYVVATLGFELIGSELRLGE